LHVSLPEENALANSQLHVMFLASSHQKNEPKWR